MKTADELFAELKFKRKEGPNCDSKFKTVHCYELDNGNRKILRVSFFNNRQIWKCNFAEMTPKLTLAIFTKIKELGWNILQQDDWTPTYSLNIYVKYKESYRVLEYFGNPFDENTFSDFKFIKQDDFDELDNQLNSIKFDGTENQSMFNVNYCIDTIINKLKESINLGFKIKFPKEGECYMLNRCIYKNPDTVDNDEVSIEIYITCPDRFD